MASDLVEDGRALERALAREHGRGRRDLEVVERCDRGGVQRPAEQAVDVDARGLAGEERLEEFLARQEGRLYAVSLELLVVPQIAIPEPSVVAPVMVEHVGDLAGTPPRVSQDAPDLLDELPRVREPVENGEHPEPRI